MKIRLITIGKLQKAWLREAQQEYVKRLSRFADLEILELNEAADGLDLAKQLGREAEQMLKKISPNDFVIALDLAGKELNSEQLSNELASWFEQAGAKLTFLIAGSNGYADSILKRAQVRVSMGKMTFPHQLARVMLLEQLFRSFKIQKNESYHK